MKNENGMQFYISNASNYRRGVCKYIHVRALNSFIFV